LKWKKWRKNAAACPSKAYCTLENWKARSLCINGKILFLQPNGLAFTVSPVPLARTSIGRHRQWKVWPSM
jgi:hypothetical protein